MRKRTSWLKVLIIVFFILLAVGVGFGIPFCIRQSKIKNIEKLGYSRDFAEYTLEQDLYDTVLTLGYNDTISHVLMSPDYREEYFEAYQQITYHEMDNFLPLINSCLGKNYTPDDINFILDRFSAEDIAQLAEHEHIEHLREYFAESYAKLKDLDRYLALEGEISDIVYNVTNNQDLPEYQADETRSDFAFDMLVNKNYAVSEDFEPDNLIQTEDGFELNQTAYESFLEMQAAAKTEGLILEINSAYRSVAEQQAIMASQCAQYGQAYRESHVAQPGFSEHHTGLALDIKTPHNGTFAYSKESEWLKDHAQDYGFIWRYQKDFEPYTRFAEEAWHYRYVGKDLAPKVKASGLSFDEYYVTRIEK